MAKEAQPAEPELSASLIADQSPFSFDLDVAARLGAQANGVEIGWLTKPEELTGVPEVIPVELVRGANPAIRDMSRLFEAYRLHPARKTGKAIAQTFDAFCELTNRHKTADSVIFADADWKKPSFTAVIDYHEATNGGIAAFGKHRIHYPFPLSEEWQIWTKADGEKMSQSDFAYFLEDRIQELASPTEAEAISYERDFGVTFATPAQLVELSRGLQVNVSSKVKAAHTLSSGEGQITWEESHQDASGKPLKVPGLFMLNIAPFFMGDKMRIPVRLRYRPAGTGVIWFYQIFRPDQFVTEHVRAALFDARQRTELPAYEGTPEMTWRFTGTPMRRRHKSVTGRLLDGVEHNAFPDHRNGG